MNAQRTIDDDMLDYYSKEMGNDIPTGESRKVSLILTHAILKANPQITTPLEFLCYMNDFTDL